jgi:hypothetical protein
MRHAANFSPEWGYLAPRPGFLRSARFIVMAGAIGATAGAAVVFSLVDRPVAEGSVAARTLVPQPVASAPVALSTPVAAGSAVVTDAPPVLAPRQAVAVAPGAMPVQRPLNRKPRLAYRAAPRDIGPRHDDDAQHSGQRYAQQPASVAGPPAAQRSATIPALAPAKPLAPRAKVPAAGASLATASAQSGESPSAGARDDDSLLAKTIGITDRVVGASQRAVAAVGVVPSWFGSIGDRFGGENPTPRPQANLLGEF